MSTSVIFSLLSFLLSVSIDACEETCSLRWTPYSVCLNALNCWLALALALGLGGGKRHTHTARTHTQKNRKKTERIKHLEYLLKSFVSSLSMSFTQKILGPSFFLSFLSHCSPRESFFFFYFFSLP